jgi:hypothetical protein
MQVRMIAQGYLDGGVRLPPEQPSATTATRRELLRGA